MSKTIKTILSILIIIAILKNYFHTPDYVSSHVDESKKVREEKGKSEYNVELKGNFLERSASKIIHNLLQTQNGRAFISNIITTNTEGINFQSNKTSYYKQSSYISDVQTFGIGTSGYYAICGSEVRVKYYIINSKEEEIAKGEKVIKLGNNDVTDLFDDIIIGMKEGQIRYAYIHKKSSDEHELFKIQVSLLKIEKYQFSDPSFIKIFDNNVNYFSDNLTCGAHVKTNVKITSLKDGNMILPPTLYQFKIGDDNYPLIFNYALQDKNINSTRSTIVTRDLLKSMNDKDIKIDIDNFSATDFLLVEFYNTMPQNN